MNRIVRLVVASCAAAVLTAGSVYAAPKCVMAGGEATMVTEDLARFMSGAALKNSIAAMGAKPKGVAKVTCTSTGLTYCIAKQRACK